MFSGKKNLYLLLFSGINKTAGLCTLLSYYKSIAMKYFLFIVAMFISTVAKSQSPCGSNAVYRQFDFWIGEWEAFSAKGKAGDSKISLLLDSCIVLEEWTSTGVAKGVRYAGKSFNTYNAQTNQWQQTWVDNVGGSTAYLYGKAEQNAIVFQTAPFAPAKDTGVIQRLSFFRLVSDKVRQLGEVSNDAGKTWTTTFDLEYRRKK